MTVRFTPQGCRVQTTCVIQPNGSWHENIVLSVDPASALALAVEESAGQSIGPRLPTRGSTRVRSTRFGFELVPERRP